MSKRGESEYIVSTRADMTESPELYGMLTVGLAALAGPEPVGNPPDTAEIDEPERILFGNGRFIFVAESQLLD